MEIRTVRRPGEKGTQDLVKKYGERPAYVRYRYGSARCKRLMSPGLSVAQRSEGC